MNISQLYCFIVVAQNENLSKAAGMLYISQSALSKSISKLEEELGVELFDRHGRKIVLNARGRRFLESSIDILHEIESATQDLRAMASGESYKLRVGCPGVGARLCDCLTLFCQANPLVSFEIDSNIEQLEYVEMSNYDMFIYPSGRPFDKLVGYELGTESYCLAVHRNHRLAERETVGIEDLMDEDFVFMRIGKSGVEFPYRVCGAQAVLIHRQYFVTSHDMHHYLIHRGLCLGFVPGGTRQFYENDPDVALIDFDTAAFERPLWVCFRHSANPLPAELAFREFAIDFLGIDTENPIGGRSSGY